MTCYVEYYREFKGSVAAFLATADNELYALTTCHVLPSRDKDEPRVVTPGGFDSLTRALAVLTSKSSDNEVIDYLLTRREEPFGVVKHGHVNPSLNGWRSDFALIRLNDNWVAKNGNWEYLDTLTVLANGAESLSQGFTETQGIVGCCDPQGGQICYRDGATTACAVGVIDTHDSLEFRKGSTEPASEKVDPSNIVVSNALLVQPAEGER